MEKQYVQKGYNSKYPDSVEIWKYGDLVPEWLSDIAKVDAINVKDNTVNLAIRETNTGGYEILDSSGTYVLVKTTSRKDYICRSGKILFSLTPIQFNLLYNERIR